MTALAYLSALCRRWGGELQLVSPAEFRNLLAVHGRTVHPLGHHAIDVGQRLVIADRRNANPGTVVHEMGHVFIDEECEECEPDWLGWEIALARRAGCYRTWSEQMEKSGYCIWFEDREHVWGKMDAGVRLRLIADRIDYAQAIGIVGRDGEPLCTRRP